MGELGVDRQRRGTGRLSRSFRSRSPRSRSPRSRARTVPLIVGVGTGAATAVGLTAEVFGLELWLRVTLVLTTAVIAGGVAAVSELIFVRHEERRSQADDEEALVYAVPRNVPPGTRHFVGREDVIAELSEALTLSDPTGAVVVTIFGKGGVGKTALALRLAHVVADHYPDGQLFATLRGPDGEPIPPAEVLTTFLDALGVAEELVPERLSDRVRVYNTRLAGRRMLIVLDNAVDEAQVRPLIPVARDCGVVVTSRPPLEGLVDATQIGLDVISVDEGVELLALVAGEDRVLAEPDAARQIVRLVGALPLAVRIAGARLRARPFWPLADLAQRLRDGRQRLAELSAGDLDVRATLGLSYADMTDAERRAFRLLGLVRGASFGAWTAAALLDIDVRQAVHLVESLERVRLLEGAFTDGTGTVRYRFHDLIRAYARERLYEEEEAAARAATLDRLTGAYLALADEACRFDEHARTATEGAGWPVWFAEGSPRWHAADPDLVRISRANPTEWYEVECRPIARTIRQAASAGRPDAAWELGAMLAAHIDTLSGFWDRWEETFESALSAAGDVYRRDGEAAIHFAYGAYLTDHDRFADAVAEYASALEFFRALGDGAGETQTLIRLGETTRLLGLNEEAETHLTNALRLARDRGDRHGEAGALRDLGGIHRWRHRYAEEEACYRDSVRIARELGLPMEEARTLRKLSVAVRLQGRLAESEALAREALSIFESAGHLKWQARTKLNLAQTRLEQGRYADAEQLLTGAQTGFEETGSIGLIAETAKAMAQLRLAERRLDDAIVWIDRSLTLRRVLGQRLWEGSAQRVRGEIRFRQGVLGEARASLDEAIAVFDEYGDAWAEADARRMLAVVDRAEKHFDAAVAELAVALRVFREYGDQWAEVEVLRELAETHGANGDRVKARELSAEARELVRGLQESTTG